MYINKDNLQRYTVGVLVDNEPGVLSRVSGLFFRRGFNIESLAFGPTQDQEVSRITIVVKGDDAHIEQLVQQLYKLICVQKVQVMQPKNAVERQLLLVKVRAGLAEREGLMRLVDIFKAKVLDVTKSSMILQITGDNDKIAAILGLLEDYGITELVRTGVVALERGDDVMNSDIFDLTATQEDRREAMMGFGDEIPKQVWAAAQRFPAGVNLASARFGGCSPIGTLLRLICQPNRAQAHTLNRRKDSHGTDVLRAGLQP